MPKKNFRTRRTSSSSEEGDTNAASAPSTADATAAATAKIDIKEQIEELKFIQKQRERTHGIDVYSLAIGESNDAIAKPVDNDPWKTKTGGLVDMRLLKERRGNEIVRNMHSNFAKETNQRDEDAEMQKFIEEQVRLKKRAERLAAAAAAAAAAGESSSTTATPPERLLAGGDNDDDDDLDNFEEDLTGTATAADGGDSAERPAPKKKFKSPSDALFDVPKYLIESQSKAKTVELLSDQMLSGIPEVDLGVEERMRNIEDTERAKQALLVGKQAKQNDRRFASVIGGTGGDVSAQYAPHNTSVNFVQHKRFDDALINPEHMIRPRMPTNQTRRNTEREPVVGDAPKHELLIAAAHAAKAGASSGGRGGRGAGGRGFRGKRHGGGGSSAGGDPEKEAEIAARRAAAAARRAANGGSNVPVERASDDLCWERFKRNMRYNNRRSKIKIA